MSSEDPLGVYDKSDDYRGPTKEQIEAGTLEAGTPTTEHREETRRVATGGGGSSRRRTEEYRGPTPEQIEAETLEVEIPDTTHRIKTRAAALLQADIKRGEIPEELIALKTHEKTLGLMEEALSPDVHPIVRGEYTGTREEYQKYQRQFGAYETEYKDYTTEYERLKATYEAQEQRRKATEDLKRGIVGGVQVVSDVLKLEDYKPTIQVDKGLTLEQLSKIGAAGVLQRLGTLPTEEKEKEVFVPEYTPPVKGWTLSDYVRGFRTSDVYLGKMIPSVETLREIGEEARLGTEGDDFKYPLPDPVGSFLKWIEPPDPSKQLFEEKKKSEEEFVKKHPVLGSILQSFATPGAVSIGFQQVTPSEKLPSEIYEQHIKATSDYGLGLYERFEKAPVETVGVELGIPFATGYGIGAVFKLGTFTTRFALAKAAGYSTKVGAPTAGKIFSLTGKVIEPAIATVTTVQIGREVIKAETPKERIEMLADVGIGFAGAAAGWRGAGKAIETYRVRGRREIAKEIIVEEPILSGVESFPMTKKGETATQLISRFEDPLWTFDPMVITRKKLPTGETQFSFRKEEPDITYVWHAAPETLGSSFEVFSKPTRKTDVGGIYTAPSLSPWFLRVMKGKDVSLYSRLFGSAEPLEPTALLLGIKKVGRLPEDIRYGTDKLNIGKVREFLKTEAIKGEATLTPSVETTLRGRGRSESESTITPETMLSKIGGKVYSEIEGHKFPIDIYKTIEPKLKPEVKVKVAKKVAKEITAKELAKTTESYGRYTEGLFKPLIYRPPPSRRQIPPPSKSYYVSPFEYVPPSRYDKIPMSKFSYVSQIESVPIRPRKTIPPRRIFESYVEPSEYYVPPRESVTKTPYRPHVPVIRLPKEDKKDKKKKVRKVKEFEVLYTNPIASPFKFKKR